MELVDLIRTIAKPDTEGAYSLVGTVTAVNETARTCDVSPENGDAELLDVRLQTDLDSDKGLVIFPKKGSKVSVTFLNVQTGFVSQFSEIEKAEWVMIGSQRIFFDAKGLKLKKENADLREQVDKLLDLNSALFDLLMKFQLMTNMGATVAVMPNIVTELGKMKTQNLLYRTIF